MIASFIIQPGSAVEREADLVAQHFLHRFDAGDHVFRPRSVIRPRSGCGAPVRGSSYHMLGMARIIAGLWKPTAILIEREAFFGFLHLLHVFGVVLRHLPGHRRPKASVVDADAVADFAAQQLVDGHSGDLARDVPESDLDGADRRAPRLERAKPADLQHDALDVGRIFAEKIILVEEDHRLEIRLGRLGLAVAGDALIGDDSNDRVAADDGASQIGDFDFWLAGSSFLSGERCRCRRGRQRSQKTSACPRSHEFFNSELILYRADSYFFTPFIFMSVVQQIRVTDLSFVVGEELDFGIDDL